MIRRFLMGLLMVGLISLISACQLASPVAKKVTLKVDGRQQTIVTEATTVRQLLDDANITLSELDRVRPDLYTDLDFNMEIIVTRVTEEIILAEETIPFEQQTVVNEALAPGETRLAQLGVNGTEEISWRVIYEDGIQISQTEVARQVITPAIPEILVVGPQGELPPVSIDGAISYLSNGNAWLMRGHSNNRRPIAPNSQFDDRVFELSPDGRYLLYTQSFTDNLETPLNELWLVSTTIVGEEPTPVGLEGILEAAWSPVISNSLVAYSTAERTASTPGWNARNDLWLFDPLDKTSRPIEIIPPNTEGLYSWWGTSFVWSPDGTKLAYARPDQIGVITFTMSQPLTYNVTPVVDFAPFETLSDWVWLPQLSWSPAGNFIAAVIHGPAVASEAPTESQQFDLWLLSDDGQIAVPVARQVGMWANPVWGRFGIAFGEAIEPLQSVNSRYKIQLIDHDGSNKRQLFPFQAEPGVQLPAFRWSPDGERLLFIYNGNLYLTHYQGAPPQPLTTDSQASQLHWLTQSDMAQPTPPLTPTISPTLTISQPVTPTPQITLTPTSAVTLTITSVNEIRLTPIITNTE